VYKLIRIFRIENAVFPGKKGEGILEKQKKLL